MRKKVTGQPTRRQCRTFAALPCVLWLAVQAYFSARLSVPIDYNVVLVEREKATRDGKNDGVEEGERRGRGATDSPPPLST